MWSGVMRIFVLVVLLFFVQFEYAFAFCENPPAKLCNMLFSNDLVVHAKVVKTKIFHDRDDPDGVNGWLYYLQVLKSYRGTAHKTVIVKSENTTSRLLLKSGKEYIVFAKRYSDGSYEAGNYCGAIQSVDGEPYSKKLDRKIQNLLKSSGPAFIEGEVRDKNYNLMPGTVLNVTGKDFSKQITVGAHGSFNLKVPPGTYKIMVPKNLEVTIYSPDGHTADSSSNDIPAKSLVSGQCMQIQLQEKRDR